MSREKFSWDNLTEHARMWREAWNPMRERGLSQLRVIHFDTRKFRIGDVIMMVDADGVTERTYAYVGKFNLMDAIVWEVPAVFE